MEGFETLNLSCPVCRAENVRPLANLPGEAPAQCRRCRADLSLLADLLQRRRFALSAAWTYLARGDGPAALPLAREAHTLRADADSRQCLALSSLLAGQYSDALAWYISSRAANETS